MNLSPEQFLVELRRRRATRVRRVSFRMNRSTVWSLTQGGRVLNLHAAYRTATPELLDAFADLVAEGGWWTAARRRRAASAIRAWPPLSEALRDARAEPRNRSESACCATFQQSRYLRTLYRDLNRTRFEGRLPDDLPLRLSNRMKRALGHMVPGEGGAGERSVREIALNVDLMLEGNDEELVDTLLHEMAHAADYLLTGHRGHGSSWRAWARRVGCRPVRLNDRPIRTRRRRTAAVTRVPPPPPPLAATLAR
ncbi:MAG: SprT family zinc-dependent metalloprotease [Gemmatimonadetes bacterium]|nr:SprT family zinc-dependent metalloprotease [Gemmatimonadota bacterium]